MAKKPQKFWVNYGGRFNKEGRVHNAGCRYFDAGHGAMQDLEEIPEIIPNCKHCGGADRG